MANIIKNSEKPDSALHSIPEVSQSGRQTSPSPSGLRQRPLTRAATFAQPPTRFDRRNSSFLSESPSEARRSIRSSTDDILLPRVTDNDHDSIESSHWHSLPLGLALLPAFGGLFFQNGSSFVTDVTLLGLAALFLNWSVRLPWDWYHAAQEMIAETGDFSLSSPMEGQSPQIQPQDAALPASANVEVIDKHEPSIPVFDEEKEAARKELRLHELLALAACFVCPLLGAWLLHAIRSQLSRPSEGLVSNYNLTIFLLGAEIRPLSHLIKLIQRRTLFLQKRVSASILRDQVNPNENKILDILNRLDELETHTVNTISSTDKTSPSIGTEPTSNSANSTDDILTKAATFSLLELRKQTQPELDALNRAMRRYEKRTTISAIQTEARLQDLESKVENVVVLAAAAQRSADKRRQTYTSTLANWLSAIVVLPVQWAMYFISLPGRAMNWLANLCMKVLGLKRPKSGSMTGSGKGGKVQGKSYAGNGGNIGGVGGTGPGVRQRSKEKKSKTGL